MLDLCFGMDLRAEKKWYSLSSAHHDYFLQYVCKPAPCFLWILHPLVQLYFHSFSEACSKWYTVKVIKMIEKSRMNKWASLHELTVWWTNFGSSMCSLSVTSCWLVNKMNTKSRKSVIWQQVSFCLCYVQWQGGWSQNQISREFGGKGQNGIFLLIRDWEHHGSTWSYRKIKNAILMCFLPSIPIQNKTNKPKNPVKPLEWLSELSYVCPCISLPLSDIWHDQEQWRQDFASGV